MKLVSTEKLEKYILCSYKLKFDSIDTSIPKFRLSKYRIFKSLSRYYLSKLCMNGSITAAHIRRKMNLLWDQEKKNSQLGRQRSVDLIHLGNRVTGMLPLIKENEQVIAIDYPISVRYKGYNIIGNIDGIVLSNNRQYIKGIWVPNEIVPRDEEKDFLYYKLISLIFYKGIKKDFSKYVNTSMIDCYNADTGSVMSYRSFPQQDINDVLKNLCSGYTSRLYYPRPGQICNTCMYNNICSWSAK